MVLHPNGGKSDHQPGGKQNGHPEEVKPMMGKVTEEVSFVRMDDTLHDRSTP